MSVFFCPVATGDEKPSISKDVKDIGNAFKKTAKDVKEQTVETVKKAGEESKKIAKEAKEKAKKERGFIDRVRDGAKSAYEKATKALDDFWSGLKNAFGGG